MISKRFSKNSKQHIIRYSTMHAIFIFTWVFQCYKKIVIFVHPTHNCPNITTCFNSSVIRQKSKSQKGCFKKTKHTKFSEKQTFLTDSCAYQGVRNVRFLENLDCFVFLKHLFWDSPFCLTTDEFYLYYLFNRSLHSLKRSLKVS